MGAILEVLAVLYLIMAIIEFTKCIVFFEKDKEQMESIFETSFVPQWVFAILVVIAIIMHSVTWPLKYIRNK